MRIDQIELTGSLSISASLATNPLVINDDYLFVSNTGNIGIGTKNPTSKLVVTGSASIRGGIKATTASGSFTFNESICSLDTKTAFKLPVGTNAERPASPITGYLRYNTTRSVLEIYLNSSWKQISFSEVADNIEYLVVAGGGGGGWNGGGGGGGGGLLTGVFTATLNTSYTVTVGAGGPGGTGGFRGSNGNNSVFATQTAIGGGGGGSRDGTQGNGATGGSGGGGGGVEGSVGAAGTVGQGNAGGNSAGIGVNQVGGGGGGAGAAGTTGTAGGASGNGGVGLANSITGISVLYAGGGGGNRTVNGSAGSNGNGSIGQGGLGGGPTSGGSSGAAGTVILKYQDFLTITVGVGLTSTTTGPSGGYKITTLTSGTGLISFNLN